MKNLFAGNLPFSATEDEIRELFGQYGEVQSINIILDRQTQRPRGFAFIQMEDEAADKAIEGLNGQLFAGRRLQVSEARPLEERPPREDRPFRPHHDGDFGDRPYRPRFHREGDGENHEGGEDRPFRPRRRDGDFGDRPYRPRRSFGDRPYRDRDEGGSGEGGDRPYRPRRSFGDRPYRPHREDGAEEGGERRPFRPHRDGDFGDRPYRPRRRDGDFGDRPYRPRRDRDFEDRPYRPRRPFRRNRPDNDGEGFPSED